MGERDLLGQFGAVLLGRAKAWSFDHPVPPNERDRYQAGQRAAVLRALAESSHAVPTWQICEGEDTAGA
jgi:hypothetical protein